MDVLFPFSLSCDEDTRFVCDLCGKSYKRKRHLQRHQKFECEFVIEKPQFPCPHCPYLSKQKDYLKKHIFFKHKHLSDSVV
ncbi:unnamed protein product [Bemisia tabaci]|uniref:C2H2-type domain-containing protein n=1 Tax=Bemisia tabaci TaxID=7038 RepID=A0A9P0A086_BEMTA|nr:unnamed protein product [Bemisia tabaci]